jgi:MFS family permease
MYLREIRLNARTLLAVSVGIGLGAAISYYTMSLFAPPLIAEFGWSKADFALVGSIPLITAILVPLAGRFTDRFGPRIAAAIGFAAVSLGFLALAFMRGSLTEFFIIYAAQNSLGILTTSLVFCRVIVERFDAARGIALSILMTGPPLFGAIAAPVLGAIIHAEGWRAGYIALAILSAGGGVLTVALMGRSTRPAEKHDHQLRLTWQELFALLRHPVFLLVVAGMFLVNLPQVLTNSQLKLIMLGNGLGDSAATWMLSLYAIGVIVGRFITGLALDRIPAHIVAIGSLGLPAIGFFIMATQLDAFWILALAVSVVGLAQGAEGDIGAYLISRSFDMKNYSLLLSFVMAGIVGGTAVGSALLSVSLRLTDDYQPFLLFSAVVTIVGALLFFLTGGRKRTSPVQPLTQEIA